MTASRRNRWAARGFASLLVLLAIAIVTIVLVSLQSSAFRQAAAGREARSLREAYVGVLGALERVLAAGRPAPEDVVELELEREWARDGDSLGIDRQWCGH